MLSDPDIDIYLPDPILTPIKNTLMARGIWVGKAVYGNVYSPVDRPVLELSRKVLPLALYLKLTGKYSPIALSMPGQTIGPTPMTLHQFNQHVMYSAFIPGRSFCIHVKPKHKDWYSSTVPERKMRQALFLQFVDQLVRMI